MYCALGLLALVMGGCLAKERDPMKPLETVDAVDLERYAGQWFEIARYHHRFQEGCVGSRRPIPCAMTAK